MDRTCHLAPRELPRCQKSNERRRFSDEISSVHRKCSALGGEDPPPEAVAVPQNSCGWSQRIDAHSIFSLDSKTVTTRRLHSILFLRILRTISRFLFRISLRISRCGGFGCELELCVVDDVLQLIENYFSFVWFSIELFTL